MYCISVGVFPLSRKGRIKLFRHSIELPTSARSLCWCHVLCCDLFCSSIHYGSQGFQHTSIILSRVARCVQVGNLAALTLHHLCESRYIVIPRFPDIHDSCQTPMKPPFAITSSSSSRQENSRKTRSPHGSFRIFAQFPSESLSNGTSERSARQTHVAHLYIFVSCAVLATVGSSN